MQILMVIIQGGEFCKIWFEIWEALVGEGVVEERKVWEGVVEEGVVKEWVVWEGVVWEGVVGEGEV